MDDTELRDQLMTLLLAGHETTATGLAWAFDLLVHHPEALERLRAELEAGERGYLDAVVNEPLRVRPVVPFTGRELCATAELGGYELSAGTVVAGPESSRAHPAATSMPSRTFRFERFLGDDAPETFAWVPFGGGAALHRRRVRPVRDEGRDRDRSPLGPPARCLLVARAPGAPRRRTALSPANGTRVLIS